MNYFLIPGIKKNTLQAINIDRAICLIFNISPDALQQKTRKREVVEPRQLAITLRRCVLNLSLKEAGKAFYLDHATAIHSVKAVFCHYQIEQDFKDKVQKVLVNLGVGSNFLEKHMKNR
jgi:chromosomal replication initiator protein